MPSPVNVFRFFTPDLAMKRISLLLFAMLTLAVAAPAQKQKKAAPAKKTATKKTTKTTKQQQPTVKSLQAQQRKLAQQREANKKKQAQIERNVKLGMQNLLILNNEIGQKRRTIDTIRTEITRLDGNIKELDSQIDTLQGELEVRKEQYMKSVRYMRNNRSIQSKMMFVFSADNFNQMYRRMRFSREYAAYQRAQGEAVKTKQEELAHKRNELTEAKNQKNTLLVRGEQEQRALETKQGEQQKQVNDLKKQQKTVTALIAQQQKEEAALNATIDRMIAEQIERERRRAAEEARRKAAEEEARKKAAAEQARKQNEKKERKETKQTAQAKPKARKSETPKRTESEFTAPSADARLSGSFEANRGRLPMPITGAYKIVRGFGRYAVEGLTGVLLESKGIHLKGQPGARARAVFDGEVSYIYMQGGNYIVTVRHGKYISVYCNLSSVAVTKGQKVKTGQVLGGLGGDNIMQFQLRNWTELLNPLRWLGR